MFIYAVTVQIKPEIENEWLSWMKEVHVPDVLRTRCFSECKIYKDTSVSQNEAAYIFQYMGKDIGDYHRYAEEFAPDLQKDHTARYSGKFKATRQLLESVHSVALT